jgi:hypothetical protein
MENWRKFYVASNFSSSCWNPILQNINSPKHANFGSNTFLKPYMVPKCHWGGV